MILHRSFCLHFGQYTRLLEEIVLGVEGRVVACYRSITGLLQHDLPRVLMLAIVIRRREYVIRFVSWSNVHKMSFMRISPVKIHFAGDHVLGIVIRMISLM